MGKANQWRVTMYLRDEGTQQMPNMDSSITTGEWVRVGTYVVLYSYGAQVVCVSYKTHNANIQDGNTSKERLYEPLRSYMVYD